MKRLIIIVLIFVCIGFVNISSGRRIKGAGVSVYSYSPEELALVREGYVFIYDMDTGQLIGRFKRYVPSEILVGHDGIVVKKRLDSGGFLNFGTSKTHYFGNYPYAFVIFEIPVNLSLSKIWFYDGEGNLIEQKNIGKIKIFDIHGNLISCRFRLPPKELSRLDEVMIETRLDKNGYLQIGGRIQGHFTDYPDTTVRVKVKKGIITSISFLDEEGNILERREFSLIYDRNFNLVGSFMYEFPMEFLQGIFYVQRRIGERGRLNFRGEEVVKLPRYSNCIGFIKIVDGEAKRFWVVEGDKVVLGTAPKKFDFERWIRDL